MPSASASLPTRASACAYSGQQPSSAAPAAEKPARAPSPARVSLAGAVGQAENDGACGGEQRFRVVHRERQGHSGADDLKQLVTVSGRGVAGGGGVCPRRRHVIAVIAPAAAAAALSAIRLLVFLDSAWAHGLGVACLVLRIVAVFRPAQFTARAVTCRLRNRHR